MTQPDWQLALLESRNDPLRFVTEVIRAEPELWQTEALNNIARSNRLAIRSGHGVGKTTLECWVTLWFMLTRTPASVFVTANSQDQLRDVVWKNLGQWIRHMPDGLSSQLELGAETLVLKARPESNFAAARTASKERPEALAGRHSKNMLVILEEASGIPENFVEVNIGMLSTPNAKVLMCGNPTRRSGFFYDSFNRLRDRWTTMHVSSEDVPRARGHIEDVILRYGQDSNVYRVRVAGEFPVEDDDVVVPYYLIAAAVERDVAPKNIYRVVWGVDVGRFGDDRSALAKRQGNVLLEPIKTWSNKDTVASAALVRVEYDATPEELKPDEIMVDDIGVGAGVADVLIADGLPVRRVNVAERAAISNNYMRLRDELWYSLRGFFEALDCWIPDDEELIKELADVRYEIMQNGKILVEPKAKMKERVGRSPDLADAFVLTFAGGVDIIADHVRDRYDPRHRRYPRRGGTSHWAA